ncbi:hypothetical protein BC629DRAFT_1582828 [Irpex lacteus]|nr:hypothetical protein BC629DRAFT_1582828 [Irpex lacteus]
MSDSPSAHLVPSEDPNAVDILEHVLAKPLPDGYWIHAFPYSTTDEPPHGHPDVIAYGLGFEGKPATVRLFTNPLNDTSKPGPPEKGWKVSEIAYLEFPVAMAYADLTGNKYNDVIICDRYGPSMDKLWDADSEKKGGRIQWLLNPADRTSQPYWKAHTIGHLTACHFTTKDVVQVVAFPIIHKSSDLTSPAPVVAFTPKYAKEDDKSAGPKSWHKHVAYLEQFRLIHDVKVLRRTNGDLDMLLVSGKEGVVLLWYDSEKVKYWGAGSVDVCRVGDDDVGYIATCEAFHGNIVAVYTKSPKHPSPADSFAVACMGVRKSFLLILPPANQGVYMYKPKIKITGESAGRLAVGSFSGAFSQTDIASTSYYVPGYHTGPDPPNVRINSFAQRNVITAAKIDKEVLRIPRPSALEPGQCLSCPSGTCGQSWILNWSIKIIYGNLSIIYRLSSHVAYYRILTIKDFLTGNRNSLCSPPAHTSIQLYPPLPYRRRQDGPFSTMSQVISSNGLPTRMLPFVRVDKTDWGISGDVMWNDFQFFNVTGFHVYFNDDDLEKVVHIRPGRLGLAKRYEHLQYVYVEKNSTLLVVPPMHEHGPLWRIKEGTKATPVIRDNDTVSYPWHAWLASEFGDRKLPIKPPLDASKQKYDVWMAFEFPSSSFQY